MPSDPSQGHSKAFSGIASIIRTRWKTQAYWEVKYLKWALLFDCFRESMKRESDDNLKEKSTAALICFILCSKSLRPVLKANLMQIMDGSRSANMLDSTISWRLGMPRRPKHHPWMKLKMNVSVVVSPKLERVQSAIWVSLGISQIGLWLIPTNFVEPSRFKGWPNIVII